MSQEALSMAKLLIGCVTRGDVNGQYHWANLIILEALANGAKGPENDIMRARETATREPHKLQNGVQFPGPLPHFEDAIEEARR